MTFHILDIIMYFVLLWIIWKLLPKDYQDEVGGATVGCGVITFYTLMYLVVFVFCDVNWIDIINGIHIKFKL